MTFQKNSIKLQKHFWNRQRLLLTAVVLSLIALGGLSSCTSSDEKTASNPPAANPRANPPKGVNPPAANNPPAVSAALPANVLGAKLKTLGGGTISLGDYSGKVLLVNLWATWCGPCRSETPELVKIHNEFQSRGLEMVGLTTEDPTDTAERVQDFVRNYQVTYHIGWATPDVAITFMQMTGRDAIPQSFIISRDGHVLQKFVGFSPVGTPPQIRQAIESALKG